MKDLRYGDVDLETKEKFCPVCKNKNERDAITCKHCGAPLSQQPWDSATTINTEALEKGVKGIAESLIDDSLIPTGGIAIYAAGASNPVYLDFESELIFGRQSEKKLEGSLFDLTPMGGYQMGISRRHAVIRKVENGLELTDLGSTNGSWLNEERLVPFKPYSLIDRSQIRFGRMRLLVICHTPKK